MVSVLVNLDVVNGDYIMFDPNVPYHDPFAKYDKPPPLLEKIGMVAIGVTYIVVIILFACNVI